MTRNGPGESILEIMGLRKAYRAGFWGRPGKPAVADLDLSVRRGEILALLGHNGAGKTTALKAVLGLVRPDAGRITIAGLDAARPEARARTGYLPEAPYFHVNLTAFELLDFHGKLLGLDRSRRRERADCCLQLVGMAGERDRRLGACSKGMRQRLGLAQALLGEPDLLILDEPQSGLDPLGRRAVRDILLAQKALGVTILFSSHIVPDVEAVADRVAVLRAGRLVQIRDLGRRAPARSFRVRLDLPTGATSPCLAAPGLLVGERCGDSCVVEAVDQGALGRLLVACQAAGIGVLELHAGGADLEGDFLRDLAGSEREPEVAAC